MNPKTFQKIIALITIGSLTLFWAASVRALSVDQVRFGVHPDKIRMVLDLSQITDYRVFALDNPYRLVVDLKSFEWRAGKIAKPGQAGIKDIRQGPLQPGISRIVFDMERPIMIGSAFLLPRQDDKPDRIVIDYQAVSETEFQKSKSRIHGTLVASDIYQTSSLNRPEAESAPVPKQKPALKTQEKPLIVIDPGHGNAA